MSESRCVLWYVGFIKKNFLESASCKNGMSLAVFLLEAPLMASSRTRRRSSRRRTPTSVGKPRGVLHPRVQQVGPEHFGIVCFDCHKASSKFLLADFYGRQLIAPTVVEHNRPALDAALAQIRQVFEQQQLRDGLVAIERTGRYHRLVQRACA